MGSTSTTAFQQTSCHTQMPRIGSHVQWRPVMVGFIHAGYTKGGLGDRVTWDNGMKSQISLILITTTTFSIGKFWMEGSLHSFRFRKLPYTLLIPHKHRVYTLQMNLPQGWQIGEFMLKWDCDVEPTPKPTQNGRPLKKLRVNEIDMLYVAISQIWGFRISDICCAMVTSFPHRPNGMMDKQMTTSYIQKMIHHIWFFRVCSHSTKHHTIICDYLSKRLSFPSHCDIANSFFHFSSWDSKFSELTMLVLVFKTYIFDNSPWMVQ